MTARIRPGEDADAEQLIALIGACWALYPGIRMDVDGEMPELRTLASYYAGAGGALWVAEDDGAVLGMAATRPHDTDAGGVASGEPRANDTPPPLEGGGCGEGFVPHEPLPATPSLKGRGSLSLATRQSAARESPDAPASPTAGRAWEICRVYVHPSQHGTGLAHRLLDTAEAHAIVAGAARLVLWSDTRFDRAHRFYEKRSYVRAGPIRVLHDISNSLEFAYAKPVNGIEVVDAAAAASAGYRLSEILIACVAGGAGVSFLPPLAPATARAFWKRATPEIAAGTQRLLCGWVNGVLAGTVTLHVGTPPNAPHRAEVQKLLVHPDARRHGLARALMQRVEREAEHAGRLC